MKAEKNDLIRGAELKQQWNLFMEVKDEASFRTLYTNYYHYLYLIGIKRGGTVNKIKDCISDLFLYLWENQDKLKHVSNHHNYIITSFIRKLFRKEEFSPDDISDLKELPESFVVPSVEATYIEGNSNVQLSEKLLQFLDKLPERQRMLLYQKFYLGLSYNEIALANNISINTVYNSIYKAISNLKAIIGKDGVVVLSVLSAIVLFFLFFFI